MMYSLDSDTVNGLLKGHSQIFLRALAVNANDLWISTIVVEELVGKQISHINSLRSQRKSLGSECTFLANLMFSLAQFRILPYTDEAETLYRSWPAKQKRVGPNDCRIAASALQAGFVVVTVIKKIFLRSQGSSQVAIFRIGVGDPER